MPLAIGQVVHNGRYRIARPLGQGGMGAIYRAWDTTLHVPAAIKENLDQSPEAERQFAREAQILARLSHPNLPRVGDYFIIPGEGQYLVMDFVEGEDLGTKMITAAQNSASFEGFPSSQVLPWMIEVCGALEYLHRQNPAVIHRDIKPANIRLTPEGKAMLVDFGIAKVFDPNQSTTMGARAVTPGFSPPEQYGMGRTDVRSDIYALGATLYTLLTGVKLPESVHIITGNAVFDSPRQLNQDISPEVEAVILKCLETDARKRCQSVTEVKNAVTWANGVGMPAQNAAATVAVGLSVQAGGVQASTSQLSAIGPAGTATVKHGAARQPRGLWLWLGGAVIILTLASLGWIMNGRFKGAAPGITPSPTRSEAAVMTSTNTATRIATETLTQVATLFSTSTRQPSPTVRATSTVIARRYYPRTTPTQVKITIINNSGVPVRFNAYDCINSPIDNKCSYNEKELSWEMNYHSEVRNETSSHNGDFQIKWSCNNGPIKYKIIKVISSIKITVDRSCNLVY